MLPIKKGPSGVIVDLVPPFRRGTMKNHFVIAILLLPIAMSGCTMAVSGPDSERHYVQTHANEFTKITANLEGFGRQEFEPQDEGYRQLSDEALRVLFHVDQRMRGSYRDYWDEFNQSQHVKVERIPDEPMELPGLETSINFTQVYFVLSSEEPLLEGKTVYICGGCNDFYSSRSLEHFKEVMRDL